MLLDLTRFFTSNFGVRVYWDGYVVAMAFKIAGPRAARQPHVMYHFPNPITKEGGENVGGFIPRDVLQRGLPKAQAREMQECRDSDCGE